MEVVSETLNHLRNALRIAVIIPCRDGGRFRDRLLTVALIILVIIPCRDGGRFRVSEGDGNLVILFRHNSLSGWRSFPRASTEYYNMQALIVIIPCRDGGRFRAGTTPT